VPRCGANSSDRLRSPLPGPCIHKYARDEVFLLLDKGMNRYLRMEFGRHEVRYRVGLPSTARKLYSQAAEKLK